MEDLMDFLRAKLKEKKLKKYEIGICEDNLSTDPIIMVVLFSTESNFGTKLLDTNIANLKQRVEDVLESKKEVRNDSK